MSKRITLNKTLLKSLQSHQERTGVGPHALMRGKRQSLPQGLNSSILKGCLNGNSSTIREDHLQWVLMEWESLPDNPWIELNDTIRSKLSVLKGAVAKIVRGTSLSVDVANKIINGTNRRARKRDLDLLLEAAQIITKSNSPPTPKKETATTPSRIHLSDAHLSELRHFRDQYGFLPGHIFKISKDIPEGLKWTMVSSWLAGQTKSAEPEHLEWVLQQCRILACSSLKSQENGSLLT